MIWTRSRNLFSAWLLIGVLGVLIAAHVEIASAANIRMAVLGDSISAGSGVSGGSPNWVAQLKTAGGITFTDKAVGGATSDTVVSGQLSSVVTLAHNGSIDDSTLIIGGNDAVAAAVDIASGGDPTAFINDYVNNIKNVISSIATANPNVHQVFGNMPDVTVTPAVQQVAAQNGITLAQLHLVSLAIGQANAQADAFALSHGVPVVDLYSASQQITPLIPLTLGGHSFTTAFAPDNFHPAVFLQGLLANMVDTAYNQYFHQSLPIISDQQIVRNAGFTPNTGTTYFNVQPFVILPTPEPASAVLAVMATLGLLACGRRPIVAAARNIR
jgi:lysophospholipase L1-like esterase